MVKLFRRFVEHLALIILIGGAIVVFLLLGRAFNTQYMNASDVPPAQEMVKDS